MSTRALLLCSWIWLAGASAHAQNWLPQCEQAIQKSQGECQQAYNSYKNSDASRLASGLKSSTNDSRNNAINLKGKIDAAKAELDKDIAQCQQAQKSCEQECDQQQKAAEQQAAKPPPNPLKQIAQQHAQQIPPKRQNDCTKEISSKTAEMQAGRAPLDQQSADADKTRDQSQAGGGQPQSPQSGGGDKSSDSGTSGSSLANTGSTALGQTSNPALNCAVAGGSRFSDCNTTFVSKCTSSMAASECDTFSDRYCNLNSAASATQTPLATATTNLVIDKRGEGLGSQFCSLAVAYRYCQTPGRESCPSCIKVYAQSSCQGIGCIAQTSTSATSAQQKACPDDPSYLTSVTGTMTSPTVDATGALSGNSSPTGATSAQGVVNAGSSGGLLAPASLGGSSSAGGLGGSGSTGGGSFGSSAATPAGGAPSAREDKAGSIIGSAEVSGGGGGGGGGGGNGEDSPWTSEAERALASADVKAAFDALRREPASAISGGAADVATSIGPSLFSLGSGAIRKFCVRGHVPNCN